MIFELAYFPLYLLIGMFAGLSAGLLGIGGGLIIVPALLWMLQYQGINDVSLIHIAIGTSLASIIFTSLSSVYAHHQKSAVIWPIFWRLSPSIMIGALLGAAIADWFPSAELKILFGLFELYVAIQMTFNLKPKQQCSLPKTMGMNAVGSGIGLISSLVGIGGGTMTVPFLLYVSTPIHKAIATSAACGLPIAIAGSMGFLLMGWSKTSELAHSSGYVYWPALLGIVIASVLFAPIGAWLAYRLSQRYLKQIFASLLYILAIKMLFF
jgi:uncharacterized membrane protein YfcA